MRTRSPRPRLCFIASLAILALLGGLVPVVPLTAVAAPGELFLTAVEGGETAELMTITFDRDKSESVEALSVPVQLAPADEAKVAMATIGTDVSTSQATLEFAAGETSASLSVGVLDDGLFEGPEVFDVLAAVGGVIQRFTVTVADSTVPKLSITTSTGLIDEGSAAEVSVRSSVAPVNPIALTVRTVSGTADVGDDVEALDALLVLAVGATASTTVEVTAVDDLVADRFEERFDLAVFLGNPADVAPDATPLATRTMRIVDNDPYLRFQRSPGEEGANIHRIEVAEPLDGSTEIMSPSTQPGRCIVLGDDSGFADHPDLRPPSQERADVVGVCDDDCGRGRISIADVEIHEVGAGHLELRRPAELRRCAGSGG